MTSLQSLTLVAVTALTLTACAGPGSQHNPPPAPAADPSAPPPGQPQDAPPAPSETIPAFRATVTSTEARFDFPIAPRPAWDWHLATTPDNHLEYRWSVKLTNGDTQYSLGVSLFKFPGKAPVTGTLAELLNAGQDTVFQHRPTDSTEKSGKFSSADAKVTHTLEGDTLILRVTDPASLALLLSQTPGTATFQISTPGAEERSWDVPIQYVPAAQPSSP